MKKVKNKNNKVMLFVIAIAITKITWWFSEPYYHIFMLEFSEAPEFAGLKDAKANLLRMGNRAIGPILSKLAESTTVTQGWVLKSILVEMGLPAKKELILRIEHEADTRMKMKYIYILQSTFSDFRYFDEVVSNAEKLPFCVYIIEETIKRKKIEYMPDYDPVLFPPILVEGKLNSRFMIWYKKRITKRELHPK